MGPPFKYKMMFRPSLNYIFLIPQILEVFGCHSNCATRPSHPSAKAAADFSQETFDYLIVGAGAAGLALAAR